MPNAPQPEVGRVYRISVNHGAVVYVTKEEYEKTQFAFNEVFWVAVACFVGIALIKFWPSANDPGLRGS